MKQSKIFNWLYFIILLIPIMLVFIPMINNYQPSVNAEVVEIVKYGYDDYSLNNFYTYTDSRYHYFEFTEDFMKNVINNYYINDELSTERHYCTFEIYDNLNLYNIFLMFEFNYSTYYNRLVFIDAFISWDDNSGDLVTFIRDDADIVRGFGLSTQEWKIADINNEMFISSSCFLNIDNAYTCLPFSLFYNDYVITTEYNSILYDFSVKMNDSFLVVGDLTEWVSDNIIDLSINDYVFFAWTYSIYIFVVSLLWLLVSFLLFIIKFANRWLNGIYEKW